MKGETDIKKIERYYLAVFGMGTSAAWTFMALALVSEEPLSTLFGKLFAACTVLFTLVPTFVFVVVTALHQRREWEKRL